MLIIRELMSSKRRLIVVTNKLSSPLKRRVAYEASAITRRYKRERSLELEKSCESRKPSNIPTIYWIRLLRISSRRNRVQEERRRGLRNILEWQLKSAEEMSNKTRKKGPGRRINRDTISSVWEWKKLKGPKRSRKRRRTEKFATPGEAYWYR